jgi:NAD(P)-dependent dehydrogenase (short-subunit alcohol dehydrogenase family)
MNIHDRRQRAVKLEGKTALITGAGKGIGRAIALRFAGEGASVVIAEIDEGAGQAVAQEVTSAGGKALFVKTDVTQEAQVKAAIDRAVAAFGHLDILVNNAGIGRGDWHAVIDVNLNGVYYGCRHGAEALAAAGGGVIINLSSIFGLVAGGIGIEPYVASKHAVLGLTREFALAFAARGVRVNCINPGFIETEMIREATESPELRQLVEGQTPMGRLGRADEVANAALFLASNDSSFMTGAPLVIDGGWTAR